MNPVIRPFIYLTAVTALLLSTPARGAGALDATDVYRRAGPAVVLLLGTDDGRIGSGGTGSIIRGDGQVITNAHVVINASTKQPYKHLLVFLMPAEISGDRQRDLARKYPAVVVRYDADIDLALVKFDAGTTGLPTVGLADPTSVQIGQPVVAIGHPQGGGLWTLTTGTISTRIQSHSGVAGKHVFQTETSLNPGNSGGPLLDATARMVGVNTCVYRQGRDGIAITDVNFSLQSGVVREFLAKGGFSVAYLSGPAGPPQVATAPAVGSTPPANSPPAVVPPATPSGPTAPAHAGATPPPGPTPVVLGPPPPKQSRPFQFVELIQHAYKGVIREAERNFQELDEVEER